MEIFSGLVTHKKSPYRHNQTYEELRKTLSQLASSGKVTVCEEDRFSAGDVSRWLILARILLVPAIDFQVKRFRGNTVWRSIYAWARETKNELSRGLGRSAHNWLIRNHNITAAHMNLWSQAAESNIDWAIIAEDDVEITDPNFANRVQSVLKFTTEMGVKSSAVFLSGSFSLEQHMAENLAFKVEKAGETSIRVSQDKGWTDTVAATVYSRHFLENFLGFLRTAPKILVTVLPVDQVLDVFLMRSSDNGEKLVTIQVDSAICKQRSLT